MAVPVDLGNMDTLEEGNRTPFEDIVKMMNDLGIDKAQKPTNQQMLGEQEEKNTPHKQMPALFTHASQCSVSDCTFHLCQPMRRSMQHVQSCTRANDCPACRIFRPLFAALTKIFNEVPLPHQSQQLRPLKSAGSPSGLTATAADKTLEERKQSIQRCVESLVHACRCKSPTCPSLQCKKMKRVVEHTHKCKRKKNGVCPICKQLIALCCYHAKFCTVSICPVPFCRNIKHKLKLKQQEQLQKAFVNHMRMAAMNSAGGPSGGSTGVGPS